MVGWRLWVFIMVWGLMVMVELGYGSVESVRGLGTIVTCAIIHEIHCAIILHMNCVMS